MCFHVDQDHENIKVIHTVLADFPFEITKQKQYSPLPI